MPISRDLSRMPRFLRPNLPRRRILHKSCPAALTDARRDAAERLTRAVEQELHELDMPHARMDVSFSAKSLSEDGGDAVEFLLSVNPGEALKPLSKIASGGEMSRIMLGIKGVLSGREETGH